MDPLAAEKEIVLAEGERRGWPRQELDACIAIESGWNPHAYNRQSNAGGLIGFMPQVLKRLGWTGTPEAFRAQSIAEQAPWVGKYFDQDLMRARPWKVPGDTYMALAAPAYTGAPDATIVYPRGSKAWEWNQGWVGPDGEITAGSIRAVCLRKMRRLAGGGPVPAAPKGGLGSDGFCFWGLPRWPSAWHLPHVGG